MTPAELMGYVGLGLSVSLHIMLVTITLGLGVITAAWRYLAYSRGDAWYESAARRAFRVMVVTELFSGVWGTIITVFLAGFFPGLTALATNVIFLPIAIAIASIMIRIPSIGIFWYTWGKVSDRTHVLIGFIMAIAGFGVPLGFRYIFAETVYPYAAGMALQGHVEQARLAVFSNPVYPYLMLHTVFAALSVGGFMVASLFAIRGQEDARAVKTGALLGLVFLVLQAAAGAAYLFIALANYAPIIYDNVFGVLLGASATINLSPVFLLKMVVVLALLVFGYLTFVNSGKGAVPSYAKYLAPLALLAVVLGEVMNDGGKYPYMVALGKEGLPTSVFFNAYMPIPMGAVYVILAFFITAIVIFTVAFYYAIFKKFVE